MLTCDQYLVPRELEEALVLLERHRGQCRVVAGATDTLPAVREGRWGDIHVPVVVDISGIDELCKVEMHEGKLRIGATTPIQRFLDLPLLREHAPVMPYCAVWFADDQLREAATLGGNIVNASPAADATPPLIAMNATVHLARHDGGQRHERSMPLADFVAGPAKTRLEEGELLLGFDCDALAGYGAAFEKVGHRRSLVISTVCVAALVRPDAQGRRFGDIRLAVGAIGPIPSRLDDCEAMLRGKPIALETIRQAAAFGARRVQSRTRREYRGEVVANFIERAVVEALGDAGLRIDDESLVKEVGHVRN